MMHNASFEHLRLDYVYLAFDVGTDKLAAAVDGLRAMNVTMPGIPAEAEAIPGFTKTAAPSPTAFAYSTMLSWSSVLLT